jgi:hypothetical protein
MFPIKIGGKGVKYEEVKLVLMTLVACGGGATDDTQKEINDLQEKVSELQKEVEALKVEIAEVRTGAIGEISDIVAYMNEFNRDYSFYKSYYTRSCHGEGYC